MLHISFKQILSDVELIAGPSSEKLIILSRNKKSTVSDRHVYIVEKTFNKVLEDYCSEILPTIIQSWEEMTPDKQDSSSIRKKFLLW